MTAPTTPGSLATRLAPYLILSAVVAAAYSPALSGGMLRWDDDRIVARNPLIGPPYLANTARMFTTIQNEAYQPLHTASYQIDHILFGLDPAGCHAINLVLYVAAACVFFYLALVLGADRRVALAGTLLFALHPVHVESVAWITGRKDVQSLFFVAVALVLHARSKRILDGRHVASMLVFALAALTKTTTLILPLWLVILDRLLPGRPWRETLWRAAAPAGIAAGLGILVLCIWQGSGLTRDVPGLASRAALVFRTIAHYALSLAWPARLSPVYEIERDAAFDGPALLGLAILATTVAAAVWLARRSRTAAAGIWLGLAALLPVSNVVPLWFQVNDRYLLLPTLGILFLVVGLDGIAGSRRARTAVFAATLALGCAAGAASFVQSFAWRSDRALWERATTARPGAYYAFMKLGETYRDLGLFDEADRAYARAIELEPDLVPARGARLLACLASGDPDAPIPLSRLERYSKQVTSYMAAVGDSQALLAAGLKLYASGKKSCAERVMIEAVESEPRIPDRVIVALASDLARQGRTATACALFDRVSPPGKQSEACIALASACNAR